MGRGAGDTGRCSARCVSGSGRGVDLGGALRQSRSEDLQSEHPRQHVGGGALDAVGGRRGDRPRRQRAARCMRAIDYLDTAVEAYASRVALVDGDATCTYAELQRMTHAIAAALAALPKPSGSAAVAIWS